MIILHKPASLVAVLLLAGMTAASAQTNNGALYYYQACLRYAQPDETMTQMLTEFRDGKIVSNETIRQHIEANRRVVEYIMRAADLPDCDWGYDYTQGMDLLLTHLASIKHITFLVAADARLLGEQGDYPAATSRCMAIHKMALNMTDRMIITYLMGLSLSNTANRTIQDLLPGLSGNVDALNQLRTQLTRFQDAFPSLQYAMTGEGEVLAVSIRKEKAADLVRDCALNENDPNTGLAATRILAGDEAFFERNRAHWSGTIAGIVAILDSGLPYVQMRDKLGDYVTQMTEGARSYPDATITGILLPATSRVYLLRTRSRAQSNALQTAIGLYAVRARTGQLPSVLPADAPADPFSGKPFLYEPASDHFTLRCQEKEESDKAEANSYEFKIKQ